MTADVDHPVGDHPPSAAQAAGSALEVRWVLGVWAVAVAAAWVVVTLASRVLPPDPLALSVVVAFPGDAVLGPWTSFDGGWYLSIADGGYAFVSVDAQANVAFFPAYPLGMRWLGWVLGGNPMAAGVVLTLVSGAVAVVVFARWCALRLGSPAVRWAVVALVVYPYAWYLFGATYADALFLAAAVGAFTLVERGHPIAGGLVGAVATAARPVGAAVVVGLIVLVWARRGGLSGGVRAGVRRLRPADAGVLLSAVGLVGWMAYQWARFGDPLVFSRIQAAWGQESGPATWFKLDFLARLRAVPCHTSGWVTGEVTTCGVNQGSDLLYTAGVALQGGLLVAGLVALPWVIRRFGVAYGVYTALVLAPALLGSQDFQGAGRYLLAAFPLFALAGATFAERRGLRRVVVPVSVVLAVTLTSFYARGYYVA